MREHRTGPTPHAAPPLAAFHAEVSRLLELSGEAFADVAPDALTPLVATIRVNSSEAFAS